MPQIESENTDALQLVRCSDIDNYNISEYLIMKSNGNINFLNVTLTLGNKHCVGCWFEDYRLYGQVSITCDSNYLIQQCTNNSKLGFNILTGYSTTDYSLNWNVLSSDNSVLLSSYHDRMYNTNEFVSQTVCIASVYQCFLLNITDSNGNGIIHAIYMNNNIAGFSGRYFQSDTLTMCTEKNYISYCIVPEFCKNNTQISKLIDYGTIYAQYTDSNGTGFTFEESKVNHTNITGLSFRSINHYTYSLDMIGFNC